MSTPSNSEPLIRGPYSGRDLAAFELPAHDGRVVRLWDYRLRRNTVLFFHHGAGCPRCRGELARFGRYYGQYRERDGEVLAIGPDEPAVAAALARDLNIPFPLLSDPSARVAARQQVSVPAVIVANR